MDLAAICRSSRTAAAVFELDELGVLRVAGEDRQSWLNGMVTNDVAKLEAGQRLEACFTTVKGKIVALADVWHAGEVLRVVTDRARIPVLIEMLERLIVMEDVTLADESEAWAVLTVQGPAAGRVAAAAGRTGLPNDRTGAGGLDLLVATSDRAAAIDGLVAAGAARGSAEALEALRLEAALPRWGADVTEDLFPQEARIEDRRVSFLKGCYVGQEPVVRLQSRGHANRFVTPVDLDQSAPPAPGTPVRLGADEVGKITSAARGPTVGRTVALALLRRDASQPGTALEVGGQPAQVPSRPWLADLPSAC